MLCVDCNLMKVPSWVQIEDDRKAMGRHNGETEAGCGQEDRV